MLAAAAKPLTDDFMGRRVIEIAAGSSTLIALLDDGTVTTCGAEQRIIGPGMNETAPVVPGRVVAGLSDVRHVAGGGSTQFAIHGDGAALASWGGWPLTGRAETDNEIQDPGDIPGLTDVSDAVVAGNAGFALTGGTVQSWGAAEQLGRVPSSWTPGPVVFPVDANQSFTVTVLGAHRQGGYAVGTVSNSRQKRSPTDCRNTVLGCP
jgi:hypothetical protein